MHFREGVEEIHRWRRKALRYSSLLGIVFLALTVLMFILIAFLFIFSDAVLGNGKALAADMHELRQDVDRLSSDLVSRRTIEHKDDCI